MAYGRKQANKKAGKQAYTHTCTMLLVTPVWGSRTQARPNKLHKVTCIPTLFTLYIPHFIYTVHTFQYLCIYIYAMNHWCMYISSGGILLTSNTESDWSNCYSHGTSILISFVTQLSLYMYLCCQRAATYSTSALSRAFSSNIVARSVWRDDHLPVNTIPHRQNPSIMLTRCACVEELDTRVVNHTCNIFSLLQ